MNSGRKFKKISFFYTVSEIDEYFGKAGLKGGLNDELCIGMTPSAYAHLLEKAPNAANTLEYFTNESHEKILFRSKEIVKWFMKNADFHDVDTGMGIRQSKADCFLFETRLAAHYFMRIIEIVQNAIDRHNPEILTASLTNVKAVSSIYVEPEEKYLGRLVKALADAKGLEFKDAGAPKNATVKFKISQINNYAKCLAVFILKYIKLWFWKRKVFFKAGLLKSAPIFFTTQSMEGMVKRFCGDTVNRNYIALNKPMMFAFKVPDLVINLFWGRRCREIFKLRESIFYLSDKVAAEKNVFVYRDIFIGRELSRKIKEHLVNFFIGQVMWMMKLDKFFDKLKPQVVLSDGKRRDDIMIGEMCRSKNIPAVFISHGSNVPPKTECEAIEWGEHGKSFLNSPFSCFALQTPIAEQYLDVYKTGGKRIRTGPLIWGLPVGDVNREAMLKKMFNGKYAHSKTKVVVHAGTPKQSYGLRLYVYETPDEYIQGIADLAKVVQEMDDTVLIVKFRPRKETSAEELKALVPFSDKVVLSVDEPFSDILGIADVLVSFSSTTIEESLQNKIPVLLYGGRGRYQHIPAYKIHQGSPVALSAVYHVNDPGDLKYALKSVLDLNIDKEKDERLFEPYIYAEEERSPLCSLLKLYE